MTDRQPKLSLKEQIDAAAVVLLQKSMGNVTLDQTNKDVAKDVAQAQAAADLMREHVSAFAAVVSWYKIRGGAAADEPPKESAFDRLKSEFRGAGGAPRKRRGTAGKAGASPRGEPVDITGSDDDGDAED